MWFNLDISNGHIKIDNLQQELMFTLGKIEFLTLNNKICQTFQSLGFERLLLLFVKSSEES